MSDIFDVIVVGGGVVGLSAAIAMSQRAFSVAVIDAGTLMVDTSTPDLRVYALNQASHDLLQTLGVWQQLDKTRVSPYCHMHVWDAMNGAFIDFDARIVGKDRLGSIIEESVIKQALLEQALTQNIMVFPKCKVSSLQFSSDLVRINSHETTWNAKLLIVADGAASTTRDLIGVPLTTWPYYQQAIVTMVHTAKPHQSTAYQVFNSDGPLAFLPLVDRHQCSIVWSTSPKRAEALMALSDNAFQKQLIQAFASRLGDVSVMGKRHQFSLHMRHAQRYSGLRWLLMGDAAHTIHPLAGLGLNVGLADVTAWLANLDAAKNPIGSNKVLGSYQRQRKHAVWQIIALMEGLKIIFANSLPPVVGLRGFGLNVCNALSPLKRLFIEHAG